MMSFIENRNYFIKLHNNLLYLAKINSLLRIENKSE